MKGLPLEGDASYDSNVEVASMKTKVDLEPFTDM